VESESDILEVDCITFSTGWCEANVRAHHEWYDIIVPNGDRSLLRLHAVERQKVEGLSQGAVSVRIQGCRELVKVARVRSTLRSVQIILGVGAGLRTGREQQENPL
jgi:hypothetical protein